MAPFVHLFVDNERYQTLRPLGYDDLCASFGHVFDDPIAVEGFIREHRPELYIADKRRDTNGVIAIGRHQHETYKVSKRIDQSKDFGRPTALGLAYGLALRPPFAPIPWRWTFTIVASTMAYSISGSSLKASNILLNTSA